MDAGEKQLAFLGEGDVAGGAFLAGVGIQVYRSLTHYTETFVGVAFLQCFHLLVLQGVDSGQCKPVVCCIG